MTELGNVILPGLVLLLTPGPTNTLLAAGGATVGIHRSLPLILCEVAGYALAISALRLFLGPFLEGSYLATAALRLICGIYLVSVSVKLWRTATKVHICGISKSQVFFATLLNPKALVFAVVILPPPSTEDGFVTTFIVLMMMIASTGMVWVMVGSWLGGVVGPRGSPAVRRASSIVVGAFASLIILSLAWLQR
jgi:threonine/homoserine/homoserine lactone efflux protein